ncbi:MAG: hypothetical protein WA432_04280 [Candidatus Babeliaceae bacterium]
MKISIFCLALISLSSLLAMQQPEKLTLLAARQVLKGPQVLQLDFLNQLVEQDTYPLEVVTYILDGVFKQDFPLSDAHQIQLALTFLKNHPDYQSGKNGNLSEIITLIHRTKDINLFKEANKHMHIPLTEPLIQQLLEKEHFNYQSIVGLSDIIPLIHQTTNINLFKEVSKHMHIPLTEPLAQQLLKKKHFDYHLFLEKGIIERSYKRLLEHETDLSILNKVLDKATVYKKEKRYHEDDEKLIKTIILSMLTTYLTNSLISGLISGYVYRHHISKKYNPKKILWAHFDHSWHRHEMNSLKYTVLKKIYTHGLYYFPLYPQKFNPVFSALFNEDEKNIIEEYRQAIKGLNTIRITIFLGALITEATKLNFFDLY